MAILNRVLSEYAVNPCLKNCKLAQFFLKKTLHTARFIKVSLYFDKTILHLSIYSKEIARIVLEKYFRINIFITMKITK